MTASQRTTTGTTVTVKDLFANYPVRQSCRSTTQSWTQIHNITVAVALTASISVTLRNGTDKVKIGEKDWKTTIEKGFQCTISPWTHFEDQDDKVRVSIDLCHSTIPRNHSFICIVP